MSWTIPRVFTAAVALALVSGIAGCSEQEAKVEKPAEQQEGMSGMSGTGGMTGTQPQQ